MNIQQRNKRLSGTISLNLGWKKNKLNTPIRTHIEEKTNTDIEMNSNMEIYRIQQKLLVASVLKQTYINVYHIVNIISIKTFTKGSELTQPSCPEAPSSSSSFRHISCQIWRYGNIGQYAYPRDPSEKVKFSGEPRNEFCRFFSTNIVKYLCYAGCRILQMIEKM